MFHLNKSSGMYVFTTDLELIVTFLEIRASHCDFE